jgi:hypothetical protein
LCAQLRAGSIHIIETDKLAASARAYLIPQVALNETALRIAHGDRPLALCPIGTYGPDPLNIEEHWRKMSVLNLEADARQKNAIEESLYDCRKTVVPDGGYQHQRFGGKQTLDVGPGLRAVRDGIEIVDERPSRHHRIKVLGVEVQVVDLMTARSERLDDASMQCRKEARLKRVCEDDENAHGSVLARGAMDIEGQFHDGLAHQQRLQLIECRYAAERFALRSR